MARVIGMGGGLDAHPRPGKNAQVIVNGKVVYSRAGWILARAGGACALCGSRFSEGDQIVRVAAHVAGQNWAAACCATLAEDLSGYWDLHPQAPRLSPPPSPSR